MIARARGLSAWAGWRWRGDHAGYPSAADALVNLAAALLLCVVAVKPWLVEASTTEEPPPSVARAEREMAAQGYQGREILLAGYAGAPLYHRSDVHLKQPNGTDVVLKQLGWDGDALYFPIDGGIRSVEWWGNLGVMVDFLHNKAISRLGKGAHGRKLSNPVVESVETEGTIAGKPAPSPLKLTDLFERFEFTHGHNTLILTPMLRFIGFGPGIRPYLGAGVGFALPHVEVWGPNADRETRTNEYQFGGGAAQAVAGLEFRVGRVSYFVEYKFMLAWISGALTGDQSWLNSNMPGDLWRQLTRWWRGEDPKYGTFSTRLAAHTVVGGAGYWLRGWRPKPVQP